MPDIETVIEAFISLLRNDPGVQAQLSKDRNGKWPVYHGMAQHRLQKPCITLEDVSVVGEVSGLGDGYDGVKSYQWNHLSLQFDIWSTRDATERDRLGTAVEKALLKRANQATLRESGVKYAWEPTAVPRDEPDAHPPLWRKAITYRVFYISEA